MLLVSSPVGEVLYSNIEGDHSLPWKVIVSVWKSYLSGDKRTQMDQKFTIFLYIRRPFSLCMAV